MPNGTNNTAYFVQVPGCGCNWSSTGLHNVALEGGNGFGWSVTFGSSVTTSLGVSLSVGLSGNLIGVPLFTFSASASWTQSITTGTSTSLSLTLLPGHGNTPNCFNVVGEGDLSNKADADAVSIFEWSGHLVGGSPVCT